VIARERCSECTTPFLRLRSSEGKYFSTALRLWVHVRDAATGGWRELPRITCSVAASVRSCLKQSKCCGPEVGNLQTACALQAFYDCFITIIGSAALRGPWPCSEASASWSIRLLLLQISWQVLWLFVWWKEQHSRKNVFCAVWFQDYHNCAVKLLCQCFVFPTLRLILAMKQESKSVFRQPPQCCICHKRCWNLKLYKYSLFCDLRLLQGGPDSTKFSVSMVPRSRPFLRSRRRHG
jgi:hypothetical protein